MKYSEIFTENLQVSVYIDRKIHISSLMVCHTKYNIYQKRIDKQIILEIDFLFKQILVTISIYINPNYSLTIRCNLLTTKRNFIHAKLAMNSLLHL